MAEEKTKSKEEKTGFVEIEFTTDWASRKKGDTETYHITTAKALLDRKVAKIVKEVTKYVPKKAER